MSSSPRWNASQLDCASSITLMSIVPTCGIFLPRMRAAIALSEGSSPASKSHVSPRYPGFASRMIFVARSHRFRT
jgi:hypothetical protein